MSVMTEVATARVRTFHGQWSFTSYTLAAYDGPVDSRTTVSLSFKNFTYGRGSRILEKFAAIVVSAGLFYFQQAGGNSAYDANSAAGKSGSSLRKDQACMALSQAYKPIIVRIGWKIPTLQPKVTIIQLRARY